MSFLTYLTKTISLMLVGIFTLFQPGAVPVDTETYRVESVYLFANQGNKVLDSAGENYTDKFNQDSTDNISARVTIAREQSNTPRKVSIILVWYSPDGNVICQVERVVDFPAGDTSQTFTAGIDDSREGAFPCGEYKVEVYLNGFRHVSPSFWVVQRYELLDANVNFIKMFEGKEQATENDIRGFHSIFKSSSTRYIYWDLKLSYPELSSDTLVTIDEQWFKDGDLINDNTADYSLAKGTTYSDLWSGWGNNEPGNIEPGSYKVVLLTPRGTVIGCQNFKVTGP